ncbi:zinc-dependent alcohol dehydrogenase family protein [bacterium]|nr:zinc-dependent alcohol dehydrogenase family protein [bacterium]
MRAWVLEKQDKIENKPLVLKEVPAPEPHGKEVRIKVIASGICRTDIHVAEGDLPMGKPSLILGHQVTGEIDMIGDAVTNFSIGDRAGIAWLNWACGKCKYCLRGEENLCPNAKFTGWDVDGGFAEYVLISEDFAYPLGDNIPFEKISPLMCAGIAGFRAFRLTGTMEGDKLGLYGFGPTASYVLQAAKHLGIESYVFTRNKKNQDWAKELGATWVGDYQVKPDTRLEAGIVFPPAGNLVEFSLSQLNSGGTVVLAPVTMTPIEIKDYNNIWLERSVISLAHITRKDGLNFLKLAQEIGIKVKYETFEFDQLLDVLISTKHGEIKGTAVIKMD